ncbi:MAG: DNA polymerase III subunit chi [Glaciecola sp.]
MPKSVTFYALPDASETQNAPHLLIEQAAILTADAVSKRMKTTVLCNTKEQAESFDEYIWSNPEGRFVPHNLFGEGPDFGTPVEIIWWSAFTELSKLRNTALVINLAQNMVEQHTSINNLIDFVPTNEAEKAAARERYKQYKLAGCKLDYKTI